MNPLRDFTYNLFRCNVQMRYYPRVFLYYFKFAVFEPFRLYEKWIMGKKVREYRIQSDPVFILGYYRSGTTHLQEVLLEDKQFGYMNFYQCFFSTAFNSSERLLKGFCGWFVKTIKMKHPAHNIPFNFKLPGEEDVAMVSSAYRYASNWGQVFPKQFKQFFNETVFFDGTTKEVQEDFENQMLDLFKRVSISNKNKRLLLKSPPQTARIRTLLKLFPNAKFIYIYRNPYEVYKSNLKLWKSFEGQHLHDITEEEVRENILWSYNKSLEYYHRDKELLARNQLFEISFEDFQKNPMGELENLYSHLKLGDFEKVKNSFKTYLDKKHGQNKASYKYTQEEKQLVSTHWKKWLEEGNYLEGQL